MKNILRNKNIVIIIIAILLGALMFFFLSSDIFKKNNQETYISSQVITLNAGDELDIEDASPLSMNEIVKWESDSSILEIDDNGKLSAIDPGKTIITASNDKGTKVQIRVIILEKEKTIDNNEEIEEVIDKSEEIIDQEENISKEKEETPIDKKEEIPVSIQIISSNISLDINESTTIKVKVTPSNAKITWTSSDKKIVSVDKNGKITGKGKGLAYIKATVGDKTAQVSVKVFEVVDIALLWGQSNMVGRSGKYSSEITTNNSKFLKNIDKDIVSNNKSYSKVLVSMPKGVAYEYKAASNKLVDISTNPIRFGEELTYNNGKLSSGSTSLKRSSGTNMIPYFAKEYYEKTNHKLIIVHAANGGRKISEFLPSSKSNLHLYDAMTLKYKMAVNYIKAKSPYYKIVNKFYVVYQGESDAISSLSGVYERDYLKVHKSLIKDLDMSFGALVYIARGDLSTSNSNVQKVRSAQIKMVKENSTIIKGSDFPYQELSKGNKSILCPSPNVIHLNSAALSQIGIDIAKSIVNSKKLK